MKVEWNPSTREVFVEGRKVERVAVYFVEKNEAPVAEWREGPELHSRPCEISVDSHARETLPVARVVAPTAPPEFDEQDIKGDL